MIEPQLETGILGVDEHSAVTIDLDAARITSSGVGGVTLRADGDHVLAAGDSMELAKAKEILGVPPGAVASVGDVPSGDVPLGTAGFSSAVANRDADSAAAAVLAAEESASANPSLRPELRTLIVRLAEVARAGLTDPREPLAPLVHTLLELRASARTAGRYGEADLIRDRLEGASIEVRDTPDGTEWNLRT
jgi:hypothetical protein